jgi:hypothetical protein
VNDEGTGVPKPLVELARLGRTLKRRPADVLAFFDRPGTSNGPTGAINGRLEHLRGSGSGSGTSPTTSPDHSSEPGLQTTATPSIAMSHKPESPTTALLDRRMRT